MATFALLHGGNHGAWCWEQLVAELEARGHRCIGPDLPCDEISAGARDWAETMVRALAGVDEAVVAVGHSAGGLALPVLASRRDVGRMVFLGAVIPVPGLPISEVLMQNPEAVTFPILAQPQDDQGRIVIPWEAAREYLYHDLSEGEARAAWSRLRPLSHSIFFEACPIDSWPDVASTYITMADDRVLNSAWGRQAATDRLKADLVELPGSHSPFLSRPAALADVLVSVLD
jgi:pimeloyl-ACP methyl ester carboxylesterase